MGRKQVARSNHPPPPLPHSQREVRTWYVFLILIICAGIFLRLYGLGQESLWLDEGVSLYVADVVSFKGLLCADYLDITMGHPPAYFILLKFWMLLFGSSPVSARLFSAVAGIAALPLMYLLGKKIFNERTALIGAVLLSFSFFHVYYSQEARMYSLLLFLTLTSMLLLFRLLNNPSRRDLVLFTLVNVLGLYTGYFYMYVFGTHLVVLWLYFLTRRRPYALGASLLASAALFIPWLTVLIGEWSPGGSTALLFIATDLNVILKFFLGIPGPELRQYISGSFIGASLLFFAALIFLCFGLYRSLKNEKSTLLVLYCILPLVAYKFFEIMFGPMLLYGVEARYLIIILPAFLLILARAFSSFSSLPLIVLVVLLILLPSLFSLQSHYTTLLKEDWRGVAGHLATVAQPGDHIVVSPPYLFEAFSHYLPEGWPETVEGAQEHNFTFVNIPTSATIHPLPSDFILVTSRDHLVFTDPLGMLPSLLLRYETSDWQLFRGSAGTPNILVRKYYNQSDPEE